MSQSTWKVVHMVHALFCEECFCIWRLLYRLTILHLGGIQGLQSKFCFTPNSVMMYRNPTKLIDSTIKQVQSLDVYISRFFLFEFKCHVCDLCSPTFTWLSQYGLGRIDHFFTDPVESYLDFLGSVPKFSLESFQRPSQLGWGSTRLTRLSLSLSQEAHCNLFIDQGLFYIFYICFYIVYRNTLD